MPSRRSLLQYADKNCLALFHCEGFYDSSPFNRTVTNVSSTIVSWKFDNGISATLTNYFYVPFTTDLKWSTQDYTIDMWVYNTALLSTANSNTHGTNVCCGNSPNGTDYFSFAAASQTAWVIPASPGSFLMTGVSPPLCSSTSMVRR